MQRVGGREESKGLNRGCEIQGFRRERIDAVGSPTAAACSCAPCSTVGQFGNWGVGIPSAACLSPAALCVFFLSKAALCVKARGCTWAGLVGLGDAYIKKIWVKILGGPWPGLAPTELRPCTYTRGWGATRWRLLRGSLCDARLISDPFISFFSNC